MSDFSKQRLNMVDNQIRPSDVTDHALIDAMLEIPRELFAPSSDRALAYIDRDMRIGTDANGERHMLAPAGLGVAMLLRKMSHNNLSTLALMVAAAGQSAMLAGFRQD